MATIFRADATGTLEGTTYTFSASEVPIGFTADFDGTIATRNTAPWSGQNVFVLDGNWSHRVEQTDDTNGIGIDFDPSCRYLALFIPSTDGLLHTVVELSCFIDGFQGLIRIRSSATAIQIQTEWNGGGAWATVDFTGLTLTNSPIVVEVIVDAANATAAERCRARWWSLGDSVPASFTTANSTGGPAYDAGSDAFTFSRFIAGDGNNETPDLELSLFVVDDDPSTDLSALVSGAPATITSTGKLQSGKAFTTTGTDFAATGNSVLISPTDDSADVNAEVQTVDAESTTEITTDPVVLPTGANPGDTIYVFVDNGEGYQLAGFAVLVADPVLRLDDTLRDTDSGDLVTDSGLEAIVLSGAAGSRAIAYQATNAAVVTGVCEIQNAAFSIDELTDTYLVTLYDDGTPVRGCQLKPATVVDRNDD